MNSLKDIIKFDINFKSAVNLNLCLNNPERINSYIPTNSSITILGDYLNSVINKKEHATLLVGPYGKGKSHLLLVLLAILSQDRNEKNKNIISLLCERIRKVSEIGENVSSSITKIWNQKRFLPVLISSISNDLNQSFILGLHEALKREGLLNIIPDSFYSVALERIEDWKNNYKDTYNIFEKEVQAKGTTIDTLKTDLKMFSSKALDIFKYIYPKITAGSTFSPMSLCDAFSLYKSTNDKLVTDHGYSGIYIVFDEFSKFIESQSGIASGSNMKLLQDICELSNESRSSQLFITMVTHKSIKEYGKYLSKDIINSFTGIEGRLIEKYFVSSSKNNYELIKNAIIKDEQKLAELPIYNNYFTVENCNEFFSLPAFRSNFLENEFKSIVFNGCFPLTPISAYLLLNISEKVAQNERTLFTFISNDEPNSMVRYISEHSSQKEWIIDADLIYDYFSPLFKKDSNNEYVHNIWLSAEYAIEKCKSDEQKKLLKSLAVILIVNKDEEIPATKKYLKLSVNISDFEDTLDFLISKDFIFRKKSTDCFVFKTRAGSELKAEIKKQRELKGDNLKYPTILQKITGKYNIVPRRYNTDHSMTRYFVNEYMHIDDFLEINSADALVGSNTLDGKCITLYSFDEINKEQIQQHILELKDMRLIVSCPTKYIDKNEQKLLKDYEIITELQENQKFTDSNQILKKELPLLLDDISIKLETVLAEKYGINSDLKVMYFDGQDVKIEKSEELVVNDCCCKLYPQTPIINNEMINRAIINTSQTKKARINVISSILNHSNAEEFYKGTNQESTVYRSLFNINENYEISVRKDIELIVNEINRYIDSCGDIKNSLASIIHKLTKSPIGMRLGVIPFYFAYVISNRKEDIIVYSDNKEQQITPEIIVKMCENPKDYYIFISKDDLLKENYIKDLNTLFHVSDNLNLTSNRIKNIVICMQRWFRSLPQSTRNIISVDQYVNDEAKVKSLKSLKKTLQKVEFNPFEMLFVDLPNCFQSKSLDESFKVINELKTYYDNYFNWIENQVVKSIYSCWKVKKEGELFHILKEWYDNQSKNTKQGLFDGKISTFMSCLERLNVSSDSNIASKIAKAVTDVYLENWNEGELERFSRALNELKTSIELLQDKENSGELELSFITKSGEKVTKLYTHTNEGTGSVLRNILEDTLDEYEDLTVNDRVSILLEMIEKIIK